MVLALRVLTWATPLRLMPLNRVYHGGPCRSFTCRKGKKRDYEYESARLHIKSIC